MSQYKYTCDECNSLVKSYSPQKCPTCNINLCDSCKSKHKFKLCQWCEDDIPPGLLAIRRTAIILMLITPIILLILPVPMPAFLMLFQQDDGNQLQLLIIFLLIAMSFIGYPILLIINKYKILNTLKEKNSNNSGNAQHTKDFDHQNSVENEEK